MSIFLLEDLKRGLQAFKFNICGKFDLDPGIYEELDFEIKNESYAVESRVIRRVKWKCCTDGLNSQVPI